MKRVLILVSLFIGMVVTSCIPYRNQIYYQKAQNTADSLYSVTEVQKPYRVQINDILNVRIKVMDQANVEIFNPIGEGDLSAGVDQQSYFDGFTVDWHGNIRIPTMGKLNVLGYTLEEIEGLITEKLLEEQFKETSNIFVTVKLTGLRYTASGEIGNPGTQTVFQDRLNIFEAVANAGEIPVTGNKKDVLIIRQYPQGQQIHHLDLTKVDVMQSPYYYIQPNDIIYVKPLRQKAWGTGTTIMQNIGTIATVLSLFTTTYLLINRF